MDTRMAMSYRFDCWVNALSLLIGENKSKEKLLDGNIHRQAQEDIERRWVSLR